MRTKVRGSPVSHPKTRGPLLYGMAGAGLGAALGWLLSPIGDQRLGLSIGAGIGALLGSVWNWWRLRRRGLTEAPSALGPVGHAGYVIGLGFCLAALWFPLRTWVERPEKWLAAVAGLLFFGGGAVVLVLLWQADRHVISTRASEARGTTALGICSVVLALASVLLAVIDNPVIGVVGALFFGLGGVVLLRRGRSRSQSDSG